MDKISVIVPVYNVEKFLSQCLGSLTSQTYHNLEILIVDDGSTDRSSTIYQKYASTDNRIKIIKQDNSGVSVARNTGLKFATGDWVHFVDSDDYLDVDFYEKMMSARGDCMPDILACDVISQNSNQYSIGYKTCVALYSPTEKFLQTNALRNCVVWRYLFRRDFLKKHKLKFTVGRIFEDMLFTPNAIMLSNYVITVPGANYHYVFNENSLLNRPETPLRKMQYDYAQEYLDQFIAQYNLQHVIARSQNIETTTYKFLLFKCFKRIFFKDCNETKYYLFGIRFLKTYKK